jgi:hypothetical protein
MYLEYRDRFWSKVFIKDPSDCWIWQGSINPQGYGLFFIGDKILGAHRVAWIISHNKPIPKFINNRKTVIRHLCGNRSCVNPNHLEIGTYTDNAKDAHDKGKGIKLSKNEILKLNSLRDSGYGVYKLANTFSISVSTVYRVLNKRGIYNRI